MDPVTAWEHPGFASSAADKVALAAVKPDASLADLVLWDEATGDTIVRAFGMGGAVKFQTSAGAAGGIAWSDVSKVGSSLADLATRSAGDLSSGTLASARLAGAYTGITSVGTLTGLRVDGPIGIGKDPATAGQRIRVSGGVVVLELGFNGFTFVNSANSATLGTITDTGKFLWGTSSTIPAAGSITVANGKTIGGVDLGGATVLGISASSATQFILNVNTGDGASSGGYVRIPYTTVPAPATAAYNGVVEIDETNHRFVYHSGGLRYYVTGTSF